MLFRAWHRGMREMDILMGQFADAKLAEMADADLDAFEELMEAPDPEIFKWLTDALPVPAEYDTPLFHKLKSHHDHDAHAVGTPSAALLFVCAANALGDLICEGSETRDR